MSISETADNDILNRTAVENVEVQIQTKPLQTKYAVTYSYSRVQFPVQLYFVHAYLFYSR